MNINHHTDSLSYWHATADPMIPSDEFPSTADAVVVGGGMLGVWTAYWLAKAGVGVVVVEKSAIGWGATGRNGGFLVGGGGVSYSRMIELLGREDAHDLYALTMEGQELAHEVVAEEAIDCQIRRNGTLFLGRSPEAMGFIQHQHQLLEEDGFESEVLDRPAVQELINTPLGDEIAGAAFTPSGGTLHSTQYLNGLARAAARHGARFVKSEVMSVEAQPGHVTVHALKGDIHTAQVVIALNAWTDSLVPEMRGAIVPTRGQILAYAPEREVFRTAIGTDVTPTGEYWQQMPDGSIIIGGCRADAPRGDSNVTTSVATPDVIAKIEGVLPHLFPELSTLKTDRTWAGLMAFTEDGLPIVDQPEQTDNVWYAGGFCGHGMPFGPIFGKLLAEQVYEGRVSKRLRMLHRHRPSLMGDHHQDGE